MKGLSHITGGGLDENIPRILPDGLGARFKRGGWEVPPLFSYVQRAGRIDEDEMYRVFNMGLGMIMAVSPADADALRALLPEALQVGEIVARRADEPKVAWR